MTKSEKSAARQLTLSWLAETANYLINECGWERRRAFRHTHQVLILMQSLGRGTVHFTYRKKNGEKRKAVGTLCQGISEVLDAYFEQHTDVAEMTAPQKTVSYWDLQRGGWRSLLIDRFVSIDKVELKTDDEDAE